MVEKTDQRRWPRDMRLSPRPQCQIFLDNTRRGDILSFSFVSCRKLIKKNCLITLKLRETFNDLNITENYSDLGGKKWLRYDLCLFLPFRSLFVTHQFWPVSHRIQWLWKASLPAWNAKRMATQSLKSTGSALKGDLYLIALGTKTLSTQSYCFVWSTKELNCFVFPSA